MTDHEITENLKLGGTKHDKALSHLYLSPKFSTPIIKHLVSKGMSSIDSNQLWTDVVLKFGLLVKDGKYKDQNNLLGFLRNLGGYMCLNFFRDNKKYKSTVLNEEITAEFLYEDVTIYNKELKIIFEEQLAFLGESCKSTLLLWARGYSMKEIMVKEKFVSVEATRKRKHICLKKLLENVRNNTSLFTTLKSYYEK